MVTIHSGDPNPSVDEAVLFPFDTYSFPFSSGLRLQMIPGKVPGGNNPIVVEKGAPGSPDDAFVRFYGTVIPISDTLHMWYLAQSDADQGQYGAQFRPCYATSKDGINWDKPDLGLVEFEGSKHNNIVNLRGGNADFVALPLIYEPDEPDANKRYKVVFESHVYGNRFAVAYSPDGLNWTESPSNPVGPGLEQTGLIRHNGCYFVNGQGGSHYTTGRVMATFASYDFETWTQASHISFRRDLIPPDPLIEDPTSSAPKMNWNAGPEVHLGAGLWDRGNVILGVYDIWHGDRSGDRTRIGMDLGFLVSHDALHFSEPVKDFRLVPAYEEPGRIYGKNPTISHGQGMYNWNGKTMLWYENWGNPPVEVRLASWIEDRLGYLEAMRRDGGHVISSPVTGASGFSANVGGLGPHTELRFELLDEGFHPIAGFSGADAVVVTALESGAGGAQDLVPGDAGESESGPVAGLRHAIDWRKPVPSDAGALRLKVDWGGVRPEDGKLFAVYVS